MGVAGGWRFRRRSSTGGTVRIAGAHPRCAGRRTSRTGHASADMALSTLARHRPPDRPRPAGPHLGDGSVLRRTVRARLLATPGAAADDRRMLHRCWTIHDAMEG